MFRLFYQDSANLCQCGRNKGFSKHKVISARWWHWLSLTCSPKGTWKCKSNDWGHWHPASVLVGPQLLPHHLPGEPCESSPAPAQLWETEAGEKPQVRLFEKHHVVVGFLLLLFFCSVILFVCLFLREERWSIGRRDDGTWGENSATLKQCLPPSWLAQRGHLHAQWDWHVWRVKSWIHSSQSRSHRESPPESESTRL